MVTDNKQVDLFQRNIIILINVINMIDYKKALKNKPRYPNHRLKNAPTHLTQY